MSGTRVQYDYELKILSNLFEEKYMSLNEEIIALSKENGCNILGFADLRSLPNEARKNFDYGIVFALPFSKEAMIENNNDLPQKYYDEHKPMNQIYVPAKLYMVDYGRRKSNLTICQNI